MKKIIALLLFSGLALTTWAQKNPIVAVQNPKGWIIKTKSSAYQLIVTPAGAVKPGYYGALAQADFLSKNAQWYEGVDEIPVRGYFPMRTPMLEVIFKDKVRDADLQYVSGDIITIDGRSTLKIVQKDRIYPLEVTSYIRVLPEFDILEKWAMLKNTGSKERIKVENMLSGSIVLPADEYTLTHLAGKQMSEFQLQETVLTPGLKTIQNKGFKANFNPPWFMVRPKTAEKSNGPAWFGSLHYSGNWQLIFDKQFDGNVQVLGGINFWDTAWDLKAGTTFETPKLTVGYTDRGEEGAAQSLAAYVRKTILPVKHRNQLRPILYNSWEATFYAVNEAQQLELAKTAKEIGTELFVIDDGWFKARTNAVTGLGDWDVDQTKFPNGLNPMIKKINDMGMDFGIWVEPESVAPFAEIYKAHPDWILDFPSRKPVDARKYLNMAKEEVYQYLFDKLSKLLQNHNIKFIKWDQNSYLSEVNWDSAPIAQQREVRIRFINNVYRLVEELRKKFPDVWFESCASGGGRVDLGMLSRMDQVWVSDNTSPLDRIYMQYGFLSALPANTMVSWVTGNLFHAPTSLSYKFDVSMAGVLGIGDDLRKWSEADVAVAKRKVAEYKLIRPLVQQGILHRLVSPYEQNRSALQYQDENTTASAVICYNMAEYLMNSQFAGRSSTVLKLKGLKADKLYTVQKIEDRDKKGMVYSGKHLMDIGIAWPVKGENTSQILLVTPQN
ncbi:MAG: alpha-galactosidase [Pedobacter sp.]|nr:alpha-galactosidase [Pedobacter sp.]